MCRVVYSPRATITGSRLSVPGDFLWGFLQFGRVTRAWVVKESIPSQDSALAGNNENNKVVAKSLGYGFVEFQDVREVRAYYIWGYWWYQM